MTLKNSEVIEAAFDFEEASSGTLHGTREFKGLGMAPAGTIPRHAKFYIYSYETPIAWCSNGGGWNVVTERKYSATTARHISMILRERTRREGF